MCELTELELEYANFCIENLTPPEDSMMAIEEVRKSIKQYINNSNNNPADKLKKLKLLRNHIGYFYWSNEWDSNKEYCAIKNKGKKVRCPFNNKNSPCKNKKPEDWDTWICNKLFIKLYN